MDDQDLVERHLSDDEEKRLHHPNGVRSSVGRLKRPSFNKPGGLGSVSLAAFMGMEHADEEDKKQEGDSFKNTFVDAEAMKDKVRHALLKPPKLQDYFKTEGCSQAIARNQTFENVTLLVIAINAIWIAHDTDANGSDILTEAGKQFQIAEHTFCCFFTTELMIRFCAYRRKTDCFRDGRFLFDAVLVILMVIETWIITSCSLLLGTRNGSGLGNASVIRLARLMRLTRMARMARLLRVVPELMILIKGMVAAIRSVLFTIVLLILIMYVFGIALTQLTDHSEDLEPFFGSVPVSMYTLMMQGCLLDNPTTLSNQMMEDGWYLAPILWMFILMATLTVMNMLVGVLCEVVSAVAATEKEENLISFVKGKVLKIISRIDQDGNMEISKGEFVQILENPTACRALQDVGVDVVGLVDLADTIFEDVNGEIKDTLTFSDFMDLILKLRGSNVATVKDIVELRKVIRSVSAQVLELGRKLGVEGSDGFDAGQSQTQSRRSGPPPSILVAGVDDDDEDFPDELGAGVQAKRIVKKVSVGEATTYELWPLDLPLSQLYEELPGQLLEPHAPAARDRAEAPPPPSAPPPAMLPMPRRSEAKGQGGYSNGHSNGHGCSNGLAEAFLSDRSSPRLETNGAARNSTQGCCCCCDKCRATLRNVVQLSNMLVREVQQLQEAMDRSAATGEHVLSPGRAVEQEAAERHAGNFEPAPTHMRASAQQEEKAPPQEAGAQQRSPRLGHAAADFHAPERRRAPPREEDVPGRRSTSPTPPFPPALPVLPTVEAEAAAAPEGEPPPLRPPPPPPTSPLFASPGPRAGARGSPSSPGSPASVRAEVRGATPPAVGTPAQGAGDAEAEPEALPPVLGQQAAKVEGAGDSAPPSPEALPPIALMSQRSRGSQEQLDGQSARIVRVLG